MYLYSPATASSHVLLTLYSSVRSRRSPTSLSVHTYSMRPPTPPSGFWLADVSLTLRGYITTSWFAVHLTSPDSLRMRLHVDEIMLKYRRCVRGFYYLYQGHVYKKKIRAYTWTRPNLAEGERSLSKALRGLTKHKLTKAVPAQFGNKAVEILTRCQPYSVFNEIVC